MTAPKIDCLIAGTQKAGTSSLKAYVGQHPQIHTHAASEFPYFVDRDFYAGGYAQAYERFYDRAAPGQLITAKSVGVMYLEESLERFRVHSPHARIVVVLRDPVERAHSAYWWARTKGHETLATFEAALDAEPERLRRDRYAWRQCAYCDRGLYAEQLERMFEMVGAERVQVFLYEDLVRDTAAVCLSIFAACGIDAAFVPDVSAQHNAFATSRSPLLSRMVVTRNPVIRALGGMLPRRLVDGLRTTVRAYNVRPATATAPVMGAETRARLARHFAPHNRRLAALLRVDLGAWTA